MDSQYHALAIQPVSDNACDKAASKEWSEDTCANQLHEEDGMGKLVRQVTGEKECDPAAEVD